MLGSWCNFLSRSEKNLTSRKSWTNISIERKRKIWANLVTNWIIPIAHVNVIPNQIFHGSLPAFCILIRCELRMRERERTSVRLESLCASKSGPFFEKSQCQAIKITLHNHFRWENNSLNCFLCSEFKQNIRIVYNDSRIFDWNLKTRPRNYYQFIAIYLQTSAKLTFLMG